MKSSILPILLIVVFIFYIFLIRRGKDNKSITTMEANSAFLLLSVFFAWTLVSTFLGIKELHVSRAFMKQVPFLWQACVPVLILIIALFFSSNLRSALRGLASSTPWHWLVFFQAFRIGALGSVLKGINGEITSSYVFWVGIPDFIYGISAMVIGVLMLKRGVSNRMLMVWSLIGPAIILIPKCYQERRKL